jgi:hypothetical protein
MRNSVATLFVIAVVLGSGCATPIPRIDYYDVETDALRRIRDMGELDAVAIESGSYSDLGEVPGLFCPPQWMWLNSPEAERMAVDQVKIRAAQLGATHISTPVCEADESMDMTNNCMSTMKCMARALREN